MSCCKTLIGISLSTLECRVRPPIHSVTLRRCASLAFASPDRAFEEPDTVEELLSSPDRINGQMKMERRPETLNPGRRWFPYLDEFRPDGGVRLSSSELIEAIGPYMMDSRKERMRRAIDKRSYSLCLVVEGLSDVGNVSAAFRYKDNRHVSMGAEKWLDIELWKSAADCFRALRSRGYRIVTTHLGMDTASIYEMDWSCPTAIVVGNEHKGISDEALELSDLHCSIPMSGMVDSFNVSVAAGILMHHAVCDRVSRLGSHGDLTPEEQQILLAEFFLRHRENTLSIVQEYVKRKVENPVSKL
ncbi:hypothetical protein QJS10_CPB15g01344 [Acorus calamus]|uniref:tRNA/rRNA methyltransferase SpoU type domain-containing protein n=1 Tax=Acorus calamus TaxID=4465 RepID=A0AAV9D713_ACOCL|nr:hypothetical protein QJS10_CPB15g01344 [Acorus calamus]